MAQIGTKAQQSWECDGCAYDKGFEAHETDCFDCAAEICIGCTRECGECGETFCVHCIQSVPVSGVEAALVRYECSACAAPALAEVA